MESEVISLPDYIHAIQVVLGCVTRACPGVQIGDMRGQAAMILIRIESARQRLGICTVDQAEFERVSGRSLPTRVILWLADCSQRLSARDFAPLATDLLALCRALETTLRACLCRAQPRTGNRVPCSRRAAAGSPAYRRSPPLRSPRRGRVWKRVEEAAAGIR